MILYERLLPYAESCITDYQAGFKRERPTVDQLFTMRQLIDCFWESNKQQIHLFVDFKQAYDSVHRPSMWAILEEMGIPAKLIQLTKTCYRNSKCSVRQGRKRTNTFEIVSGLKQGCILSPILFNIIMEKVAPTILDRQEGAKFVDLIINCLGYADDIDIVSESERETEALLTPFKEEAERIGLQINQNQTKSMKISREPAMEGEVELANMSVEVVESFKYLGMTITRDGRMEEEIRSRIGATSRCYYNLLELFKKRSISAKTKLKIYNTIIRPILLCGCEAWALTKALERKLELFKNKILRKITGPVFDDDAGIWRIRHNWEIREITEQPNINQVAKARRMQWAGHMARMEEDRVPKRIYQAQMIGRRPAGRPRKNWDKCLIEDLRMQEIQPVECMDVAQDRGDWRYLSRAVMGLQLAQRHME